MTDDEWFAWFACWLAHCNASVARLAAILGQDGSARPSR